MCVNETNAYYIEASLKNNINRTKRQLKLAKQNYASINLYKVTNYRLYFISYAASFFNSKGSTKFHNIILGWPIYT